MLMGFSSPTLKGPFSPWPSSSRFLSSSSVKPLKRYNCRREIHAIQHAHGTVPNITLLNRFPWLCHSSYHVVTSAASKHECMPIEDSSSAPCNPNQNSFQQKSYSGEIPLHRRLDFKRTQGSRNHGGRPFPEIEHNNLLGHNLDNEASVAPSTPGAWILLTNGMRLERGQLTACNENESLADGSSYLLTKEDMSYKQRYPKIKLPTEPHFVPASTEPKDIDSGNGAFDSKKESSSPVHLDKNPNATSSTMECLENENPEQTSNRTQNTDETPSEKDGHKDLLSPLQVDLRKSLSSIYDKVLVVDNISAAKEVVRMLTGQYRHLVHACDTEVAKIDVKQETPIDHGEIICFSIYSGAEADFGNGKSCVWVDVLDGGGSVLLNEFAPFFEDPAIKKVWHNYSFDNHVIENYGLKLSGFHADTMHMARLWDSSRRTEGGYSLEALTGDSKVMSGAELQHEKVKSDAQLRHEKVMCGAELQHKKVMSGAELQHEKVMSATELQHEIFMSGAELQHEIYLIGKTSMKTIFARKKLRKDGSEGKTITIPPVEELQKEERELWICYSALDAISTLKLYESLKEKLEEMRWEIDEKPQSRKSMFDFYQQYWRPFGQILVKMETEGMLVDRAYLAEIEKLAKAEQQAAVAAFRNWASRYCPDAKYMNVGSDAQLRQLLFGTTDSAERIFKVPNTEGVIEEGKKRATKFRNIKLHHIGIAFPTEKYTGSGLPSVSGDVLKSLAAKIADQYGFTDETPDCNLEDDAGNVVVSDDEFNSQIIFPNNSTLQDRREAFHAIGSLCKFSSIDTLISSFILPLQGSNVSGKNGRVHCSLNINTETGRLSARRPNLQNQPALEKDRYKIRKAFIAAPGNSLIVADYGQLELRILAHLAKCKSMLNAFKAGGDFHSRTALNMYPHIRKALETEQVLLEWQPQPGEAKPPVPLLKDAFASERRKAKMLNFSIAYGKTPQGLARDWKVSEDEAKATVDLWYKDRPEVLEWQIKRKKDARELGKVHTLLGRARRFPSFKSVTRAYRNHIERAAINTPVQGSAADVAMCAMLEISNNVHLKELGWRLLLQVHDEVILEGPSESAEVAKAIVVECMSKPFNGKNILSVDLNVDAKCAQTWFDAK